MRVCPVRVMLACQGQAVVLELHEIHCKYPPCMLVQRRSQPLAHGCSAWRPCQLAQYLKVSSLHNRTATCPLPTACIMALLSCPLHSSPGSWAYSLQATGSFGKAAIRMTLACCTLVAPALRASKQPGRGCGLNVDGQPSYSTGSTGSEGLCSCAQGHCLSDGQGRL